MLRVISLVTLTVAVALLLRVYLTVDAAITIPPMSEGALIFDLDWPLWFRAAFIGAHACLAGCLLLIWKVKSPLSLKLLALILLGEVIAIYLGTLRLWQNGVDVTLY